MDRIGVATSNSSGLPVEFVVTDDPPRGCMKYTYYTPDRTRVVQFFNDPSQVDEYRVAERLDSIVYRYNPTVSEEMGGAKGNSERTAEYFRRRFCWPLDTVYHRRYGFGIVSPAYPSNFFFDEHSSAVEGLDLKGRDKSSKWYTGKARRYLDPDELGDFRAMLQICVLLARSVRRLHQAGLAHSDLSCKNVLIDPKTATCVVIDVDSLVVPNVYPPEVMGTRGYIAPEVLATSELPEGERILPSIRTDLHSLAVLVYEYLFCRHPLTDGPKVYDCDSAERDDFLALGAEATFIEDPVDTSNRPDGLEYTVSDMGEALERLLLRAFVDGLHHPDLRPTALEWERGLVETWDSLHSCKNPHCTRRWFVLRDVHNPVCPFCHYRVRERTVRVSFLAEKRTDRGEWVPISRLIVEDCTPIMLWHVVSSAFPDERADRTVQAYVRCADDRWTLTNHAYEGMYSADGSLIPKGYSVRIVDGMSVRLTAHGVVMRFEVY